MRPIGEEEASVFALGVLVAIGPMLVFTAIAAAVAAWVWRRIPED